MANPNVCHCTAIDQCTSGTLPGAPGGPISPISPIPLSPFAPCGPRGPTQI